MKKVVGIVAGLMMLSTVALASPVMDFSQGKGSIDLTMRNTENTEKVQGSTFTYGKKYTFDGAATVGLGNNFAVQIRTFNPESKSNSIGGFDLWNVKLKTTEVNALYKVDKNVAVFAGLVNAKADFNDVTASSSYSTNSRNLWQIGVVGSTEIAAKTNLWGSVAAGSDLVNWEVGIGYEFSPNWEFNVNYREVQAKKLSGGSYGDEDVKAKGLGLGVTYKF